MVTFDCSTSHHDGVTLVTGRLRDIDQPTSVCIENRLDGPVWPPRHEGVPAAGWTETGFEGIVSPGSHAFGYATPATPAEPAATLVEAVPAPGTEPIESRLQCPEDVLRECGDPTPPADAVPVTNNEGDATTSAQRSNSPAEASSDDYRPPEEGEAIDGLAADTTARLPATVAPWLAAMGQRVDDAESLSDAETLPEATAAISEVGGLAGARTLAEAADERQLRAVAQRAQALADRRAETTVPVETLAKLR